MSLELKIKCMSAPLLNAGQKSQLNQVILQYLRSTEKVSSDTVEQLCKDLSINLSDVDREEPHTLERRWAALVRLQRKLLDSEQEIRLLKSELKEARINAASNASANHTASNSIDNWLPKWPPRRTLEGHRSRVTSIAFNYGWTMLASGSDDGSIKIWDYEQGEIERTIKAHTRAVHSVAFAAKSRLLISCSADLSIRVWDPSHKFANTQTLVGHDHTVSAVTVATDPSTNKEFIVSASRDKTVRVWELATGFPVHVVRSHTDWVRAIDVMSLKSQETDLTYLLSAGSDRTVRLTQLFGSLDSSQSEVFEGHTNVIECCAFAPLSASIFLEKHYTPKPTDLFFASGGRDCTIMVWASGNKGGPILALKGHDNWIQGMAFHPSGRFLVTVSDDKTMRIWDLATAKLRKTIPAHEHFVTSIAWQGKNLATGSIDQTVKIW